jgi:hypothetical protein
MGGEQTVSAHKRRIRAEVQELVAEFTSSGMRRSEFCRSRGLSFSTLDRNLKKRRWKRKRTPVSSAGRLVKVELAAKQSPTQHDATFGLPVVLPGGRRIEVHPDFDTNTFERLVSAPGARVSRVWIGSSHTHLSGRWSRRHAQGFRGPVRSGPGPIVVRAAERAPVLILQRPAQSAGLLFRDSPPGLPISRSGASQTLLPLCESCSIHRPGHSGDFATTTP